MSIDFISERKDRATSECILMSDDYSQVQVTYVGCLGSCTYIWALFGLPLLRAGALLKAGRASGFIWHNEAFDMTNSYKKEIVCYP